MATVRMRIDNAIFGKTENSNRIVLTLIYEGSETINFEEQIHEDGELDIELPSTSPPGIEE